MALVPKPIPNLGLYPYPYAVDDIAVAIGLDSTSKFALLLEMSAAIRLTKLQVRDPVTGGPFIVTPSMDDPSPYVTIQDVNNWLAADGRDYEWILSTTKKHRVTENIAFLQVCFENGVENSIESVWQYIRANAGKDNFLFKTASNTTATTVDGNQITKSKLARTLARLLKNTKNK